MTRVFGKTRQFIIFFIKVAIPSESFCNHTGTGMNTADY